MSRRRIKSLTKPRKKKLRGRHSRNANRVSPAESMRRHMAGVRKQQSALAEQNQVEEEELADAAMDVVGNRAQELAKNLAPSTIEEMSRGDDGQE